MSVSFCLYMWAEPFCALISPLLPGQESESQGSMSIRSHFSVLLLTLECPFPHPPAAQSEGECWDIVIRWFGTGLRWNLAGNILNWCRELTDSQVKKGRLMGELHAHCVQIAVCRWELSHRLTGREGLRLESDVNHINHGSPDLLLNLRRECCLDWVTWSPMTWLEIVGCALLDGPCRRTTGTGRIQWCFPFLFCVVLGWTKVLVYVRKAFWYWVTSLPQFLSCLSFLSFLLSLPFSLTPSLPLTQGLLYPRLVTYLRVTSNFWSCPPSSTGITGM